MGKRLIIKGADFSNVAVSKEEVVQELTFGTSRSFWSKATTKLSALAYGTGYSIPKTGKIVSMTVSADNAGFIAIATYRLLGGSWVRQNLTGKDLVQGINVVELDFQVEEEDIVQVNVNDGASPISYGNGKGDYPTVTDGVVDSHPHALPFDFDVVYTEE